MREKWFAAIAPQVLTTDGTAGGRLTVANAALFKTKQLVRLGSGTQAAQDFEVKRVLYPDVIYVGPLKTSIDTFANISAYLVADGAFIEAIEQNRTNVPEEQIERLTYEEEPVVARRCFLVDQFGRGINLSNPLPVKVVGAEINIDTVNVDLTHLDDTPNPGDIHDSIRIGDGVEELAINPDGSINVAFSVGGTSVSAFDEANGVVNGVETTIVSYTVPIGFELQVDLAEFDGDNIARYEFQVDGTVNARKHTWFNGDMCGQFEFNGKLKVAAGSVVRLRVLHNRPDPGQFSGRILGVLV